MPSELLASGFERDGETANVDTSSLGAVVDTTIFWYEVLGCNFFDVLVAASLDSFGLAALEGSSLVGLGLTSIPRLLECPFAELCPPSAEALGDSSFEEGALTMFEVLTGSAFRVLASRPGVLDDENLAGRVVARSDSEMLDNRDTEPVGAGNIDMFAVLRLDKFAEARIGVMFPVTFAKSPVPLTIPVALAFIVELKIVLVELSTLEVGQGPSHGGAGWM